MMMTRFPRNRHLSTFILLLLCSVQVQASVSARLDRSRISEGETVTLQIHAQGQLRVQPDTSHLTKDFDVLGVSSSSQVNIVNGRRNDLTSWSISLAPRRSGELEIPSLDVGGEKTRPLKLTVSDVPVASSAGNNPIFIETEVNRSDPYVQGMVRYTVKIFFGVSLLDAQLTEPKAENALVRQLGEDGKYTVDRNGRRYQVVERRYAIFPQKSGSMEITSPLLAARVSDPNVRRRSPFDSIFGNDSFFGGMGAAKTLRLRGKAMTLQVQPRPYAIKGPHWIPAESLLLTESWQPEDGDIHVGDPLTRTITIQAVGLMGEQLPDLQLTNNDGFKVYPDKSKAESQNVGQGVSGVKSRGFALVPTRAGRFSIPSVKLYWWDINANRQRVAELPARTIEVLPPVGGQPNQSPNEPAPAQQSAPDQTPTKTQPAIKSVEVGNNGGQVVMKEHAGFWPWSTLLIALIWLATLILWWRDRGQRLAPSEKSEPGRIVDNSSARKARSEFLTACNNNDPAAARKNLLVWAKAHWSDNPPKGLNELVERLDDDNQAQLLKTLDSAVYSRSSHAWSGRELANSLTQLPKSSKKDINRQSLPELYQS